LPPRAQYECTVFPYYGPRLTVDEKRRFHCCCIFLPRAHLCQDQLSSIDPSVSQIIYSAYSRHESLPDYKITIQASVQFNMGSPCHGPWTGTHSKPCAMQALEATIFLLPIHQKRKACKSDSTPLPTRSGCTGSAEITVSISTSRPERTIKPSCHVVVGINSRTLSSGGGHSALVRGRKASWRPRYFIGNWLTLQDLLQ
jgi:hypothetical protein